MGKPYWWVGHLPAELLDSAPRIIVQTSAATKGATMTTAISNHPGRVQPLASQQASIAGVFYVVNTVTAMYAYFGPRGRLSFASGLFATAAYIVVTVLFYFLFKPVDGTVSLFAAVVSMAGATVGNLEAFHVVSLHLNALIFFGFYCVLIGYLVVRSKFLPSFLGVLMVLAGLGYLTLLVPPLARALNPYNLWAGGVGEWTLTAWLLVKGVDQQRWDEQAGLGG
jgi:Domain of unknown function (DUF4386)